MYAQRFTLNVTTAADGSATVYTPENVWGRVLSIQYVQGSPAFSNNFGFVLSGKETNQPILTQTNVTGGLTRFPRAQVCDQAGLAETYSDVGGTGFATPSGDTHQVLEPITIANEPLKLVISAGGNAKVGTFHIVIG